MYKPIMRLNIPTQSFVKKNVTSMTVNLVGVLIEDELTAEDFRKIQCSRKLDVATIDENTLFLNCRLFEFSNFRDYAVRIERESTKYKRIISDIVSRNIEITLFGVILDPLEISDDIAYFSDVYFKFDNDITTEEEYDLNISKVQIKLDKTKKNALKLTKFMKRAIFTDCNYRMDDKYIYVEVSIYQRSFRTIQEFSEMLGEISSIAKWFEDDAIIIVDAS